MTSLISCQGSDLVSSCRWSEAETLQAEILYLRAEFENYKRRILKEQEQAVKFANDTEFGLGSSIWSEKYAKENNLAKDIEAGMVFVNSMVVSDPRVPFGGVKNSGIGRELSNYGLKEFVNVKSVIMN